MSNHRPLYIPRRQILRGILATAAFGATSQLWTACAPSTTPTSPTTPEAGTGGASPSALTIGFIYVGAKDDFGYNQAHADGAAAIAKLPGVKIVEEANIPETNAVKETMRSMIEQDGVKVLFPTSFGYFDPHIVDMAKEFPEVQFFHCAGLYEEGKTPKNIGSYYGYIDEAQYLSGIIAAHTSKTGKLGFVGAKPIPQVLRNVNSFALGARLVKPDITTKLVFTGDWAEPIKEAEATNSLADQGIDVVTCHVDSPKVIVETAEKRGMFTCGYHASQAKLAPKGYLTGAEWDWETIYTNYVTMLQAGKTLMDGSIPHVVRGGIKEGFWKTSPFGAPVSDEAKKQAEEVKAKFLAGDMLIYRGEIKDNSGKVVIPTGKEYEQKSVELEKMNWLAQGVIGSVG